MTDLSPHYWQSGTKYTGTKLNTALAAIATAIDASGGGDVSGLVTVADRTALAALTPADGDSIILTEGLRFGVFEFDASDLSTYVTADTQQGIYVAPASDATGASGAWVRPFAGPINAQWFGLVADDNGTVGTDNFPALDGACTMASWLGVDQSEGGNAARGARKVIVPAGLYYCSDTLDQNGGGIVVEGEGGFYGANRITQIRFAADKTGFRTQRSNTSGGSAWGGVQLHPTSDYCIFRGLCLIGAYAGTEAEAHGIHMRSRALVIDCNIRGFQGDGIHISATAPNGNANCWGVFRCAVSLNRYGLYVQGTDSNQGKAELVDASYNRVRPIYDDTFGNKYDTCHALSNGILATDGGVNYSGQCYTPVPGQEEAARTNAPSGTTADNAYWLWVATYTQVYWATWTSGMAACRSTGGYYAKNASNGTVFDHCYSEGEGPAIGEGHSEFRGGIYSARTPIGAYVYTNEGGFNFQAHRISLGALGGQPEWLITTANGTLNFAGDKLRVFSDGTVRAGLAIETGTGGDAAKVVGARGAAVADATGGGTVDTEARAAINALLARLRASTGHGLISG